MSESLELEIAGTRSMNGDPMFRATSDRVSSDLLTTTGCGAHNRRPYSLIWCTVPSPDARGFTSLARNRRLFYPCVHKQSCRHQIVTPHGISSDQGLFLSPGNAIEYNWWMKSGYWGRMGGPRLPLVPAEQIAQTDVHNCNVDESRSRRYHFDR